MHRHRLLCALLSLFAYPASTFAATTDANAIPWRPCTFDETGWDAPALVDRLQCGTMQVPFDHRHPDAGEVEVGLIRVLAGDPARREGTIFFNFGGPGGNPRKFLPSLADGWNALDASDAVFGLLRTVADRYDLVAVVPRGLAGGRIYDCLAGREGIPFNDLAADQGEDNWRSAERDALSFAADCNKDPFFRVVDTEQHVHDMEYARRLFGDAPLNFYGTSYGTWAGAWYGAMYPEHVGRMLFDSSMDVTRDFQDAVYTQVVGLHNLFLVDAARPALAAPERYGLGIDEDALLDRVRAMPMRAHAKWVTSIGSPAQLAAALTMADWLRDDQALDEPALAARVAAYRFHADNGMNAEIRDAANELLTTYFYDGPSPAEAFLGTDGLSVYRAVTCNDTPWTSGSSFWRALSLHTASRFPGGSSSEAHSGLTCANWLARGNMRPDMAVLGTIPAFLMIQAEFDPATSLADASHVLESYDNARMVLAKGLHGHGVLMSLAAPRCVVAAAGTYLLTGQVPDTKRVSCEAGAARVPRSADDRLRAIETHLERLSKFI